MTALRAAPLNSTAPWAEIVPDMPLMTTDELDALPEDGWTYELVNGILVRVPLSSGKASHIGVRIGSRLSVYVEDRGLGAVTGEQGGYRPDPAHRRDTEIAPDVAFVRADRVPASNSPEYDQAWPLAPDLAVEVASKYQYAPGMAVKAKLYLGFGTRMVWVVGPRYERVDVWHPHDERPTPHGVEDTLHGEDVVPGFTYPIARLFA